MNKNQSPHLNHFFFNIKPVKNIKEKLPPKTSSIIGQEQRTFFFGYVSKLVRPPPLFFSDINRLIPRELTYITVEIT